MERKKGAIERGANFFEKLHYGIGAVAFAGAALIESAPLAIFAAYEIAHGALWNWVKNRSAKKQPADKPGFAPVIPLFNHANHELRAAA